MSSYMSCVPEPELKERGCYSLVTGTDKVSPVIVLHFCSFISLLEAHSLSESTITLKPRERITKNQARRWSCRRAVHPKVQCYQLWNICSTAYSTVSIGFEAKILQTGMVSFLLSNLSDGWTGMSCINTLSPTSRFVRSTSIFGGMCSAGQRYTRLVLIFCKKPPALSNQFDSQVKNSKRAI